MGVFRQYDMMYEVTSKPHAAFKPSAAALVQYLRDEEPITKPVREWLIRLLSSRGDHGVRLALIETRGRRSTDIQFRRDREIYDYVHDFERQLISSSLCRQLARSLRIPGPVIAVNSTKTLKPSIRTEYLLRFGNQNISLTKGKRMPKRLVLLSASSKFKLSVEGIRKILKKIDKAIEVGRDR